MRPEFNSRRLFGITRSKGKMYELGLPEASHIAVPANSEPQELFLLTVGTLGDVAADLSAAEVIDAPLSPATIEELGFSASFFDAFLASKFSEGISHDVMLLAASAYYLARRPGSSLVLARQLGELVDEPAVDRLLHWILQARWDKYPSDTHPLFGNALEQVARLVANHFQDGSGRDELNASLKVLRSLAYDSSSARELLFIDIISAIVRMRMVASAWATLPAFTGIDAEHWAPVIRRPEFPKELWPSQILLGRAGIFAGASGVIQMPTSAGKTRSVEIILRSGFLSGRAKLAVVVAPFRALCHEIAASLRHSFRQDDIKVNELSDAMQVDFLEQVAELLGEEARSSRYVLVLTPEKFLYVLRQAPYLVDNIGIVVYDEGHQFDSGARGITYELLLTEIKALLPVSAQTVLVSAVIQNAQAVAHWLMGDDARVVNGNGLMPTARSVAFASWKERLGRLLFFESNSYAQADYFVPRVIESEMLTLQRRERAERHFPEKGNVKDVSLYLGIRLVSQGAVAIFCGRKDTASGIASRAVDIYERDFSSQAPAEFADPDEIRRLTNLIEGHFGAQADVSKAAALGVFVHHGNTPHGIRLSIEHAMQQGRINFVVCTSTLAQGVNLPIRYLIVSSAYQAGDRIKVRDFQNLIGRAGRAGIHTEGLIIFADPAVYDKRLEEQWRFNTSIELLSPENTEDTTSSLLILLSPITSTDGTGVLRLAADELSSLILSDEQAWISWASNVIRLYPGFGFVATTLVSQLRFRRKLLVAVENYLMANRGTDSFEEYKLRVQQLAASTLAYHLSTDEEKPILVALFSSVAEYVESLESVPEKQGTYSKTLLGVKDSKRIEHWVNENRQLLLSLGSNENWLAMMWPLLAELAVDKFFHTIEPAQLPISLAMLWMRGSSYSMLIEHATEVGGTKPWGENRRRRITDDDIIGFCESTIGFESSLVIAAVAHFLFGQDALQNEEAAALNLFQKSLKYGLPDSLAVSFYEQGFADRVVALRLRDGLHSVGYVGTFLNRSELRNHGELVGASLADYPSYFESVLHGLI